MNLIEFVALIVIALIALMALVMYQDEKRIKDEEELRRCTMTECYFNDDLMCRSLTDTWNPDLLDNCPDYTED